MFLVFFFFAHLQIFCLYSKVSLETQIDNAVEMNLIRMYQSMLDGATEAYEAKVASIKKKAGQADIHTSLIANGVLTIER